MRSKHLQLSSEPLIMNKKVFFHYPSVKPYFCLSYNNIIFCIANRNMICFVIKINNNEYILLYYQREKFVHFFCQIKKKLRILGRLYNQQINYQISIELLESMFLAIIYFLVK